MLGSPLTALAAATNLFKLLLKYRPEDKKEKKERLLAQAEAEKDGKPLETKKPVVVKFGINHVTYLVEQARPSAAPAVRSADALWYHRTRRPWWSLLMTWTPSSWWSGCPRFAAR